MCLSFWIRRISTPPATPMLSISVLALQNCWIYSSCLSRLLILLPFMNFQPVQYHSGRFLASIFFTYKDISALHHVEGNVFLLLNHVVIRRFHLTTEMWSTKYEQWCYIPFVAYCVTLLEAGKEGAYHWIWLCCPTSLKNLMVIVQSPSSPPPS